MVFVVDGFKCHIKNKVCSYRCKRVPEEPCFWGTCASVKELNCLSIILPAGYPWELRCGAGVLYLDRKYSRLGFI